LFQQNPVCFIFKTSCWKCAKIYLQYQISSKTRIDFNYRINPGYTRWTVIAIDVMFIEIRFVILQFVSNLQ